MKNIYILDEYASSTQNGIGTFLQELLRCLKSLDVNICLVEFNSIERQFTIKAINTIKEIHFPPFRDMGFLNHYKVINNFFRLYIEDSPDNVFMINHSPCEMLIKSLKESYPLSKIIFTIHDFGWTSGLLGDVELLKEVVQHSVSRKIQQKHQHLLDYFYEEQRMYEASDKVICLSEDTLKVLENIYGVEPHKIQFMPNGLEDTHISISEKKKKILRKKKFIGDCEKIILFNGRTNKAKGIHCLLESFRIVLKKHPECRLVIAGGISDTTSMLKLTKNIASKVTYTGQISKEELALWYQISDIGVIPSYTEQCSYTGIEMMMYGLPVVASDGLGVRKMFQNENNAVTAKIGNRTKTKEFQNNLSNAMLEILQSESLRKQLGEKSRQTYELLYLADKMQKNYKKMFESL